MEESRQPDALRWKRRRAREGEHQELCRSREMAEGTSSISATSPSKSECSGYRRDILALCAAVLRPTPFPRLTWLDRRKHRELLQHGFQRRGLRGHRRDSRNLCLLVGTEVLLALQTARVTQLLCHVPKALLRRLGGVDAEAFSLLEERFTTQNRERVLRVGRKGCRLRRCRLLLHLGHLGRLLPYFRTRLRRNDLHSWLHNGLNGGLKSGLGGELGCLFLLESRFCRLVQCDCRSRLALILLRARSLPAGFFLSNRRLHDGLHDRWGRRRRLRRSCNFDDRLCGFLLGGRDEGNHERSP